MSRLASLDRIFSESIGRGDLPGVVATVGSREGVLYQGAFGRRDIGKPAPMTADTVFWIASMTKAITTVAVMQLVEQGRIDLDQPVSRYAPALGEARVLEGFDEAGAPRLRAPKSAVTMRRLLTHTAGYGYDFASGAIRQYMKATGTPSSASGQTASLSIPLLFDPGEAFQYGISTDWAGRIVEAVSGQDLDAYFAEHIFRPLGMADTMFVLGQDQHARRATVHAIKEDAAFVPTEMVVQQDPEFFSGGGGLYSTAADYLAFVRMILNDGLGNGQRILKAETIAAMAVDQIPHMAMPEMKLNSPTGLRDTNFYPGMSQGWSLGFLINRETSPEGRPAGSLAWGGFANTLYWIDRKNGISGILLSQVVPFFDPRAIALFKAFEAAVYREL
ncbi:serine hydrolase domain-containing protein [Phreatobacter stygius]|uniref:Beta-lactamase family protein n=1 Tax=Phreatobacter stygius TaxID=1940610 RepID=A0A4D7BA20_9HYPH|nr:serine hydrolase domain-containing protein [Phreatobacter stygius]QCI64912.1 beta-lactamase family protein [Phreatobacter stygius]